MISFFFVIQILQEELFHRYNLSLRHYYYYQNHQNILQLETQNLLNRKVSLELYWLSLIFLVYPLQKKSLAGYDLLLFESYLRPLLKDFSHLEFLEEVGDPATGEPIGNTSDNLKAAIAGETHEYTDMYPGMAKTARDEGFDEIADWFETLAKAEKSHAGKFQRTLDDMG